MPSDRAVSTVSRNGRAPFKIVIEAGDCPGQADVIDRETGWRIGYVLQNFHGHWSGYLACSPGDALRFGTMPTEERYREILRTDNVPVYHMRYRKNAAEHVWHAWKELQA